MSSANSKWYFTKKQVSKHFGDSKHEVLLRRSSASFIQEVGIRLKLPQLTIATAITYFQRFFIRHQLKDHDRYIIATTCLFLACKVEEAHRKLLDVIRISYMMKNKISSDQFEIDKNEIEDIKSKILASEHLILTTIAFDLAVDHPYKYLLEYIKVIGGSKNLCQVAWNFVNDSLRTCLCLHYPPEFISYAAVYLATKYLNYQLNGEGKKPWWEILQIKLEVLEDISKQILDLYETTPPGVGNLSININGTNGTSNSNPEIKVEATDSNNNNIKEENKMERSPNSSKKLISNSNLSDHRYAPYNRTHQPSPNKPNSSDTSHKAEEPNNNNTSNEV